MGLFLIIWALSPTPFKGVVVKYYLKLFVIFINLNRKSFQSVFSLWPFACCGSKVMRRNKLVTIKLIPNVFLLVFIHKKCLMILSRDCYNYLTVMSITFIDLLHNNKVQLTQSKLITSTPWYLT